MNLGELKVRLLLDGLRVDDEIHAYDSEFLSKRYYYGKSDKSTLSFRPPQEILLSRSGYVTGVTVNPYSPWILRRDERGYLLYQGERFCGQVFLARKPRFYDMRVNGRDCARILSIYGSFILSAFVRGSCDFFTHGEQCRFCSLNPTRHSSDNDGDLFLRGDSVFETAQLALRYDNERIAGIMLSGGSWLNRSAEVFHYSNIVRAMQRANTQGKRIHVLMSPPQSIDQFQALKDAGASSIGMSLEVFDRSLFAYICPGKSTHIGYDRFLTAYQEAVSVFGGGNVYSVFVGGLESSVTLMEGMKQMCEMGVVPSINIFHPNPNSFFENRPSPSYEQVIEISQYQGQLFSQYGYLPAVFGFNRSSVDGEVYYGCFSAQADMGLKSPLFVIDPKTIV